MVFCGLRVNSSWYLSLFNNSGTENQKEGIYALQKKMYYLARQRKENRPTNMTEVDKFNSTFNFIVEHLTDFVNIVIYHKQLNVVICS